MTNAQISPIDGLTRRRLLRAGIYVAGSSGLVGALSNAFAQGQNVGQDSSHCSTLVPKRVSKTEAEHQTPSTSSKRCDTCRLFLPPDQCVVVEGPTTADSTCELWADKRTRALGCIPG